MCIRDRFRLGQTPPPAPPDNVPYATLSKPIKTVPFYQTLATLGRRSATGVVAQRCV